MLKQICRRVSVLAVLGIASAASAAPTVNSDFQTGPGASAPFTPTYTVDGPNLLAGLTPTASTGDFTTETTGGTAVLTNGTFGSLPIYTGAASTKTDVAATGPGAGSSITYTLAGPSTITEIEVLGGWSDNGRDAQNYTVSIATGGSSTFAPLNLGGATVSTGTATVSGNTVGYNPAAPGQVQIATRTRITDSLGGPLATNVTAVRFNFGTVENNYTGTAELAVIGTPEPGTFFLLGTCGLGLLTRRRRV
jgi:hypothetical protein